MVNTVFSGQLKKVSLGIHHSLTAAVCAVLNNCVEHSEEIVFRIELSMAVRMFQFSFHKDMLCSV